MEKTIKTLLLATLLAVMPMSAYAQRTSNGSFLIDATGSISATDFPGPGAELMFGQYLLSSYWKAGVQATCHSHELSTDYTLGYGDLVAKGEWMYRLYGTRNRMFSLYGGAGLFLGYEVFDPWQKLPEFIRTSISDGAFLYGLFPAIEAELFISSKVALRLLADVPVNFSSPITWYHVNCGLGLRITL